MNLRHTYVLRMAAANLAAAAFVSIAFFGAGTQGSLRHAVEAFAVALVFSICIGVPSAITIPRLSKPLWQFPFPLNWIGFIAAMFTMAMAGSALAIAILVFVGYIPATAFGAWFVGSIRYAIITTLIFGVSISAYEMLRGRLDQALLDVRTKERDEAEARRLAAEAQLASLESKVQPHFLFNTLNSIASLIPSDPSGAERMTGQLAALLRSSLDGAERPLVPLAEELVTVREYLDIERVRFGARLRCSFDVAEEAQAARLRGFRSRPLSKTP
jgi:hypothetical protein